MDLSEIEGTEPIEYSVVEYFLSNDGKTLYLYALPTGGDVTDKEIIREKWGLTQTAPKLLNIEVLPVLTAGLDKRFLQMRDSGKPELRLVPTKPISEPPNLLDLLHAVQLAQQVLLGFQLETDKRYDLSDLLAEYWGCASRRDNFIILCRRKRLLPASDDGADAKRRQFLEARHARRTGRIRPKKAYDDQLDFDEMSESDNSSQASDFDLVSDSAASHGGASSSGSENSKSLASQPESEPASDQEDTQSLSRIGSTRTGSTGSWETSSSSFGSIASSSSSSSRWSATSNERVRTREFLTSSGNAWHYREIIEQHQSKECDVCHQSMTRWLHCFECLISDYDVCLGCVDKGKWCLDKSHEMLEADGDGPIVMRRFSEWVFANELRVCDVNDDGTFECVVEFSAEKEDLLHESQPALHPSAPIFAWPLSPTKLLLGSFKGEKERVIQRMKPFTRRGRKIDVQVRFSDSGSHLFVGSIEAVKIRGQAQEEAYNLHMQVAVLQLRFDGENLTEPVALCERHHDLRVKLPSVSDTLPFVWTWKSGEVCLALTTDKISLWRVQFTPSGPAQLYLGPVEASTARRPSQQEGGSCRAQFIYSTEADFPFVALAAVHLRDQFDTPPLHYIEADSPWSVCDIEGDSTPASDQIHPTALFQGSRSSQGHDRAFIKSKDVPMSTGASELSQVRSEIRLLCLLPGSSDDALRCTLTKVSLDDLEVSKSKLMERYSRRHENDSPTTSDAETAKRRKKDVWGPETESTELARLDYSKPENANVTLVDFMAKAISQSETLLGNVKSIGFRNITGSTLAVVGGIMEERKQDRTRTFKSWLHPKYNYEALSYVWGQSVGNHTITLDGKRGVPVTDNLYAALRRLRRPDRQRTLWVDAVCINQKNVEERSWQVQMMGRIYSTAARVVIWLGDGEVPPSLADEESNHNEDEESDDGHSNGHSSSSESTEYEPVGQWEKDTLTHVLNSASPPWWTRAWVTQELVQADDVHVAFGAVEVNWLTFHSKMWGVWSSFGELEQLIELRQNRRTWHYKGSIGETALLARHTTATDDRDKVYSLLSLIKPGQESLIKPDYSLGTAEVFTQATYADLWDNVYGSDVYKESPERFDDKDHFRPEVPKYPATSSSDQLVQTGLRPDRFRILNWAKRSHRIPGMPSWAVDFADPTALTGDAEFRYGHERWTFDGNNDLNERAVLKTSEDKRQLTVRGAIFGRIKDMVQEYPVREYRNKPAEEVVARLLHLMSDLPSGNPYDLVSGPHAKPRTDDLRVIQRPTWVAKESLAEPGTLMIEHEDVVTQILGHWDPEAENGTVDWTDLYSMALNRGNCKVQGCRCGPSQLFRSWDTCVGIPHHVRNIADYDEKKTSPWGDYCRVLEGNKPARVDSKDPLKEEQSRFLLTTSSGFIGLGPESAEVGDVIALFYGSDIPVILRPERDHFVYRGRAWINGIMQGELWNIYEDPLLEEQDFVIA